MRRVDVLDIEDDGESLSCGIVQVGQELRCAEGNTNVASSVISSKMITPDQPDGVSGAESPDEFFRWAPTLQSGIARRVSEEYDDDDALYDLDSGLYIGDDENPPIPDVDE